METFVTSDIHAYHKNLILCQSTWTDKSTCRDFPNEVMMTEFVFNNINSVVKQKDRLICLGDWSFGFEENVARTRNRIICENVILILGNHDKKIKESPELQRHFTEVHEIWETEILGHKFHFSHYPPRKLGIEPQKDVFYVHGDSHSRRHSISPDAHSLIMDAGLDGNYLLPWRIEEIIKYMTARKLNNHHEIQKVDFK